MPPTRRGHFLTTALARSPDLAARQHMRAWASNVGTRLRELGLDTEAPVVSEPAADEAMRLVLARNKKLANGARATISLSIDERHVEVAVELPSPDVPTARARLTDAVRALELLTALEALPEQFAIGIVGEEEPAPASRASTDEVRALLARAEHQQRALWLGWSVSRDVAAEHADLLEEQLEDAAVALAPVFAMLVSTSDGLGVSGGGAKKRERHERSRSDEEIRGTERRARKPNPSRERERDRERRPDAREADGPSTALPRAARDVQPGHAVARLRPRRTGGPAGKAHEIEKGSRVRVLEGPFSGKVGVVQELDGRPGVAFAADATGAGPRGSGVARVMLGLLAVRVDVRDLALCAEGRARPILSTSHRKRSAVRS